MAMFIANLGIKGEQEAQVSSFITEHSISKTVSVNVSLLNTVQSKCFILGLLGKVSSLLHKAIGKVLIGVTFWLV